MVLAALMLDVGRCVVANFFWVESRQKAINLDQALIISFGSTEDQDGKTRKYATVRFGEASPSFPIEDDTDVERLRAVVAATRTVVPGEYPRY